MTGERSDERSEGANRAATSRREMLSSLAVGAGLFLGSRGTDESGDGRVLGRRSRIEPALPPLRDAFFLVRDDGGVDWGLLFDEAVFDRRGDVSGSDLFSFSGASPDRVAVEPRPIEWGRRFTTSRSAQSLLTDLGRGDLADEARGIRTTSPVFDRGSPATLGFYAPNAGSADVYGETHSLTGTIDGLLPPFENFARGDAVSVPAIDYTGGDYASRSGSGTQSYPPERAGHIQLYDGYTHTLPGHASSDYSAELGGRFSGLYAPVPLYSTDTLIPSFSHRLNPALPILNSMALGRSRVFASVAELANRQVTNIRREVIGDAVEAIVQGSMKAGPGVPYGKQRYGELIVTTSTLLLPVATGTIGGLIAGPVGAAAGVFVGEAIGTALTAYNILTTNVRELSNFSVFEGVTRAQTRAVLEPLFSGTTPAELSTMAGLQASAGTRALALGSGSETFRTYARLLDEQKRVMRQWEATYSDSTTINTAPEKLKPFLRALRQYLGNQVEAIEREKRLLRQLNLGRIDFEFTDVPETTETGDAVRFSASATEPPAGGLADPPFEWTFDRRQTGTTGSTATTELVAGTETKQSFESPGDYTVTAAPRVRNDPTASGVVAGGGGRREFEVVADVTASIAIPNYDGAELPVGEAVRFDASGSASLAAGASITRYEWYLKKGADEPEQLLSAGELDTPVATGERPLITFDAADTYSVVLVVEDTRGRVATTETEVLAFGEKSVVARMALPSEPITVGETVTFDGSGSKSAFDGPIDSYEWDVTDLDAVGTGDTSLGSGTGASFTFAFDERPSNGGATVSLRVEDATEAPNDYVDVQRRTVEVVSDADGPDGTNTDDDSGDGSGSPPEIEIRFHTEEVHEARTGEPVEMSVAPIDGEVIRRTAWQTQPRDDVFPVERTSAAEVRGDRYTETFDQAGEWDVRVVVETDENRYVETEILWVVSVDFDRTADLDGDGLREDVNGNGRFEYDDVTSLRRNLESTEFETHRSAFDFDGDGDLDSDDVEALFDLLRKEIGGP